MDANEKIVFNKNYKRLILKFWKLKCCSEQTVNLINKLCHESHGKNVTT